MMPDKDMGRVRVNVVVTVVQRSLVIAVLGVILALIMVTVMLVTSTWAELELIL